MCRCADLALKHLENAEKNMDHLNAEFYEQKLDLISGINDVKVILYYEKGKIDIEFYNDIDTGISNLRNALNVNPNYSAELMLAGAKSSINRGEYKFAAIYLSEIVNCSEVAAMFRREAQQYQSKIPAGY